MAKSLEQVKSALKLRTQAKDGALTLRMGVRKYVLPFETRLIASDEYVFVHIPPSAEILKVTDNGLEIVEDLATADIAVNSFKKAKKRSSARPGKSVDFPDELLSALKGIPAGYKIGYDAIGTPKLIRTRKRGKKNG